MYGKEELFEFFACTVCRMYNRTVQCTTVKKQKLRNKIFTSKIYFPSVHLFSMCQKHLLYVVELVAFKKTVSWECNILKISNNYFLLFYFIIFNTSIFVYKHRSKSSEKKKSLRRIFQLNFCTLHIVLRVQNSKQLTTNCISLSQPLIYQW